MTDEQNAALSGHSSRNSELLTNLHGRGVDLNAPRSVEHHFWSTTQRDAALLARELYARGYLVLVLAPATPKEGSPYTWNVEVGTRDTPAHAGSDAVATELIELAGSFNSRYDGWGTSV